MNGVVLIAFANPAPFDRIAMTDGQRPWDCLLETNAERSQPRQALGGQLLDAGIGTQRKSSARRR